MSARRFVGGFEISQSTKNRIRKLLIGKADLDNRPDFGVGKSRSRN